MTETLPSAEATKADHARLRVGSHWLTAALLIIGLLNYAYALVLTHFLTAGDYAAFAAAQALLLVVGMLASSSVPWVLAHRLATEDAGDVQRRQAAVSFAFVVNAAAGSVAAVVLVTVAWTFLDGPALLATGLATFLLFVSTTPVGWLQGTGRFAGLASLRVAEVVVKIAVGVVAGALGGGVTGAIFGFAAGAMAVLLVGCWRMREDLSFRRPNLRLAGALRMTLGMTAIQGLVAALTSVDVVLVALLPVPVEQASTYQAAAILAKTPLFIASGIAAAVFPLLGASRDASTLAATALKMYVSLTVPVVAVTMTVPGAVLGLVLPAGYAGVTTLLPLLAPVGGALGLLVLGATVLQSQQRYRAALRRMVPGLVASVLLVTLGWHVLGVTGIAVGVGAGVLANVVLLNGATRPAPAGAVRTLGVAVAAGAALSGVLGLVRPQPFVWLPMAAVVGGIGLHLFLMRRGVLPEEGEALPDERERGATMSESEETAPSVPRINGVRRAGSRTGRRGSAWAPGGPVGGAAGPVVRIRAAGDGSLEILEMPPARYVVVSPHLDDAVLSCGELLLGCRGRSEVTVVSLFTRGDGPCTLSARAFLRQCGFSGSGAELYRRRREEDARVLDSLGVDWVHADFEEALFRRKPGIPAGAWRALPEMANVYPTYRFHVARGRVSRHDEPLVREARDLIAELVRGDGPTVVLAPLGIGGHVDHVLARDAARSAGTNVIYYADVPYALHCPPPGLFVNDHGLVRATLHPSKVEGADVGAKRRLIDDYTSQSRALFPDGVPDVPDTFYVPRSMVSTQ